MKVFPEWMKVLGINAHIVGIDLIIRPPSEISRLVVQHIKRDPLVCGALVTTHKVDLLHASHDLFDRLDIYALLCKEISCIAKKDGLLEGYAKDPISSGKTWQSFVPKGHFGNTQAEVLCFGSGGAAVATTVFLANLPDDADRPRRFTLIDIHAERLDYAQNIHTQLKTDISFEYVLNHDPLDNDRRMAELPHGSVVINGTGMGKDLPSSPISDSAIFPRNGIVWEFNYRGELDFLKQAQRQAAECHLIVEDGWVYFLHGWTQVIAEVFHFDLTPALFARLDETARAFR